MPEACCQNADARRGRSNRRIPRFIPATCEDVQSGALAPPNRRPSAHRSPAAHCRRARWRSDRRLPRFIPVTSEEDHSGALAPPNRRLSAYRSPAVYRRRARWRSDRRIPRFIPATSEEVQSGALAPPNRRRVGARRRCAAGYARCFALRIKRPKPAIEAFSKQHFSKRLLTPDPVPINSWMWFS